MANGWRALRMAAGIDLRGAALVLDIPVVRLGEVERGVAVASASEMDRMARIYGRLWDEANPPKELSCKASLQMLEGGRLVDAPPNLLAYESIEEPGEYEQLIANTCSPEEAKRRKDSAAATLELVLKPKGEPTATNVVSLVDARMKGNPYYEGAKRAFAEPEFQALLELERVKAAAAEVVIEFRERAGSEWHSDEPASVAYGEAADLVVEKLRLL